MMHPQDKQYRDLALKVLTEGEQHGDRTGVGTYSLFGEQMRFDLRDGFPVLTTKKVHLKSVIAELLWMLSGDTNVRALQDQGVTIWDEWADENGDLGPVYGSQWRVWCGGALFCEDGHDYAGQKYVDQIAGVIKSIQENPNSRRHIVTAWNPAEVDECALPPCHCFFQFNVKGGFLDCQLYQRSADLFLGVPFNIASYALLMSMIARVTGLVPRHFVHTFGDVHIYKNHVEQVMEQIRRDSHGPMPQLILRSPEGPTPPCDLFDRNGALKWGAHNIQVLGYRPAPAIKAPVAV